MSLSFREFGLANDLAVGQNQWDPFWGRCTTHFRLVGIGMFTGVMGF